MLKRAYVSVSVGLVAFLVLAGNGINASAAGVNSGQQIPIRSLITGSINENNLVTLGGNTRPEANSTNDRGAVPDDLAIDHMFLLLQRTPEREQALENLIEELNDKASPNFHQWLKAEEYGQRFGAAPEDIAAITDWLTSHGFQVNQVYPNQVVIDFSGTAGEIREAFHASIHQLQVHGESHIANMGDPQIPSALAPAVAGIFSLNDFKPHPLYKSATDYTFAGCTPSASFPTEPGNCYAVTPQDNQTIYNLNPLYSAGISGQGQTVVLVEDTDLYSANDWNTYRNTFGLVGAFPLGTLSQVHPGGCADPGANGDDGEAIIDVEVASGIAPNAAMELISCTSGTFTFGGLIALQNLINASGTPPAIASMSYGLCEAVTGAGGTAGFFSTFQQAAAEGVSVFVSSGDELSSDCDNLYNVGEALPGLGVTGWGETPYNVSVGGTDFADVYNAKFGGPALSTYWNATNSPSYGSAKSYIPEMPWNDSCANIPITTYVMGGGTFPYGSTGFCNTSPGNSTYLSDGGASGGPSNCATGFGGTIQGDYAVTFGGCQGYPKPAWQSVVGNPADGVRDVPDVSMFAANGIWGHYEVVCWSDPRFTADGAAPCVGPPSRWSGFGGTSISSPTMAAIQALVNQHSGQSWGNPNSIYYQIARTEYGTFGNPACNSSAAGGPASNCTFNDVTQGDIDVVCSPNGVMIASNCYLPSGTYGVESTNAVASFNASTNPVILSGGKGYTSAPTCTIGAPSNLSAYYSYSGGTQATCKAAINSKSVTATGAIDIGTAPGKYSWGSGLMVTVGATTYTFVDSAPTAANEVETVTTGTVTAQQTGTAKNLEAAINANAAQCATSSCFGAGTVANASATATITGSTVKLTAKTTGYAGNFTVAIDTFEGPFYLYASGGTNGAGPGYVSSISVTNGGKGYGPNSACTLTGGGGTGALCVASIPTATAPSSYQPAFGATSGWDFASGIGTPNAYNLVMNTAW